MALWRDGKPAEERTALLVTSARFEEGVNGRARARRRQATRRASSVYVDCFI